MSRFSDHLDALNRDYESLHTAKEDAFWAAMMGLGSDAPAARALRQETELAWTRFLQDPARLAATEEVTTAAEAAAERGEVTAETLEGLRGWLRTLRAHALASPEARALSERIIEAESALAAARSDFETGYDGPDGFVACSTVKLGTLVRADKDPAIRVAAWKGLRAVEDFVLDNGFLELVALRNQLARLHGFDSYYAWKVERTEQLTIDQIFDLLDDLEVKTHDAGQRFVDSFRAAHGDDLTHPAHIHHLSVGDALAAQDPYFSFADSVDRWGRSFAAMGIDYRGAELVLDLVDRRGKYENGFMHGPEIAWRDDAFKPARIHFTSNAIPGMVGSGYRATTTLFHEGGHAAHFSNIDMPAPCFGQEFAPTSAAFAETQSMFLDSLLDDADWLVRYARDAEGNPMPLKLIEEGLRQRQPISAFDKRAWLTVCYGERAIYDLPADQLTADGVRSALRDIESRLLFLDEGSPRPVLSIPHLLAGESSAYYHAYVLAEMAVQQTRRFFLERDGHLVDNPRIGPELKAAYWKPGNSRPFFDYIETLTGTPLSADALAEDVNRTADEAVAEAHEAVAREPSLPRFEGPVALDARIRIAHGDETVAELQDDWEPFANTFRTWVQGLAGTALLLLTLAPLLAPAEAAAQGNYNIWSSTTYDFQPLDGTGSLIGVPLLLSDDDAVVQALPFPFTFYGNTYSSVRVGMNGALSFDLTSPIPAQNLEPYDYDISSNVDIAVYWDDLQAGSGNVWYAADLANNRIIISWEDVLRHSQPDPGSFQVHLYDDDHIEVHWADTDFGNPLFNAGISATTSVQDQTGQTLNWQYIGFDSIYVVDGTAISIDECADADGDGALDPACGGDDCDDTQATIYPGGSEFCNGIDDDCDGALPVGEADADGDGVPPCNGDCDDADPTRSPLINEVCDGIDNDCSGVADFGGFVEEDADGDGYLNCNDCDDTDATIATGAPEVCDGIDNDCDGTQVDENFDEDNDGYSACQGDCDDTTDTIGPGVLEACNGIDDDCDPLTDEDVDDDADGETECEGDCDDTWEFTYSTAPEICDGEDNDCDGVLGDDELDLDGDGMSPCAGDCDDDDPLTYDGAPEQCDNVDNNCDGSIQGEDFDADGDGITPCEGDCDDFDDTIYGGAPEVCDGIDNNCDGSFGLGEDDNDGDGYLACDDDCNDDFADVNPGATEICDDGLDNDCDGDPDGNDSDCDGHSSGHGDDDDAHGDDDDDDTATTGCDCQSSVGGDEVSVLAGLLFLFGLAGLKRRRI